MQFFPENVASFGGAFDSLATMISVIAIPILILAEFLILFFVWRYRRKVSTRGAYIKGETWKQLRWVIVPVIFILGLDLFIDIKTSSSWNEIKGSQPEGDLVVRIIGQQYAWVFEYQRDGEWVRQADEFHVPAGKNVIFQLTSSDVIHSLWIPQLRLKQDAVPGRVIPGWFRVDKPGTYEIMCAEICGAGHTVMQGKLVVEEEPVFQRWLASIGKTPAAGAVQAAALTGPAARGMQVAQQKTCTACHSIDGSKRVGPTWKGTFGKKDIVLANGAEQEVLKDVSYLRRAILQPAAEVAKGFGPVMPDLSATLSPQEVDDLIEYIKSLK